MGDNSGENGFPHYTPQHPLPEEIKKLTRDDTVHFISYFLFSVQRTCYEFS